MMEPVAQCLIVRQTEQVQTLAKSASVTLASSQSDKPSRVTAQQESSPPGQYENYLRNGEGLQLYVPLYCSFRGDIMIQERGYAREYALLASELRPAREFQDSCVFWVDSSFARLILGLQLIQPKESLLRLLWCTKDGLTASREMRQLIHWPQKLGNLSRYTSQFDV